MGEKFSRSFVPCLLPCNPRFYLILTEFLPQPLYVAIFVTRQSCVRAGSLPTAPSSASGMSSISCVRAGIQRP